MRQIIFSAIVVILCSASCNKEKLPEYYFQCKVDGQEYKPDNCTNCLTKELSGDTILLLGANKGNESLSVAAMKHFISVGTYNLANGISENKGSAFYDNTIGNPSDIYRSDSLRTGVINITELDKTNKTISGTFYFNAYNAVTNKTVNITDGKFRLQYKTN